jgi:hypothetical protein
MYNALQGNVPDPQKMISVDQLLQFFNASQQQMQQQQQPQLQLPPQQPQPQQFPTEVSDLTLSQITQLYQQTTARAAATASLLMPSPQQQQPTPLQQQQMLPPPTPNPFTEIQRRMSTTSLHDLETTTISPPQQQLQLLPIPQPKPQQHNNSDTEMDTDSSFSDNTSSINYNDNNYPPLPQRQQLQQQSTRPTYSQQARQPAAPQQQRLQLQGFQPQPSKRPRQTTDDQARRHSEIQKYVQDTIFTAGNFSLEEDRVIIQQQDSNDLTFYFKSHVVDSLFRNKNRVVHPSTPTLLMDDTIYSHPPTPTISCSSILKNNPFMFLKQKKYAILSMPLTGLSATASQSNLLTSKTKSFLSSASNTITHTHLISSSQHLTQNFTFKKTQITLTTTQQNRTATFSQHLNHSASVWTGPHSFTIQHSATQQTQRKQHFTSHL